MSYPGYTPTPPPATGSTQTPTQQQQQQPPQPTTTPSYPYGAYSYHPPTPGAYSYAGAYQAGVTSYGWTYPYSYVPQLPATAASNAAAAAAAVSAYTPRPATSATQIPSTTTSMPQRTPTFSSYTPNYARESVPSLNVGGGRGGRRQSNLKGLFTKELKNLMYGFGDDRNPASDTVNVMEEILIEYITDVCQTATGPSKKARLSIDDLRRALSRPADAKKLARMEELLFMQEDIKRARAQFEESDIHNPKGL